MSRVICLGYFDRGNCGDEAFKVAHEWFFGAENIDFRNSRLTLDDVAGRPVVLGGGDVVAPFFLDWIPPGVPFDMVGVGLKYEQSSIAAVKAKGADFRHAWFRNRIDVELCAAAGIESDYIPDIVFALRDSYSREPSPILQSLDLPTTGRPKAIVCLADHFNSRYEIREPAKTAYLEFYKWELARTFDAVAREMDIIFVPLSVYANHLDHRFHYEVFRRMQEKRHCRLVKESLHPLVSLQLFAQVDYVFSMKLHGNIFGLVTKRRCVNIGVGRKQQKLYEEAGLQDISLEPMTFSKERFMTCLDATRTNSAISRISELTDLNYESLVDFREQIRARYDLAA